MVKEKKKKVFTGIKKDKPTGISEKVINILKIINLIEQGNYPSVNKKRFHSASQYSLC